MTICEYLKAFYFEYKQELVGAGLGLLFSFFLWLGNYIIKRIEYYYKYRKYSGNYISYLKNKPAKEHYHLKLTRHGRKFAVSGNSCLSSRDRIIGEIEMSSSIKNYGKGYYRHDSRGKYRFGFYEIQLTSSDILVHQEIKNLREDKEVGDDYSTAYVWKKQ